MSEKDREQPTLHALLIAVDYYLPGAKDGLSYPILKGSVRDVKGVEGFLKTTMQVPDSRIVKLMSSQPGDPPETLPSYENMVAAFRALTARAAKGDQVYIHYSGHGGRTKPTAYPDRKGPDAPDESLVPYNISDPSARYLLDLELATLLQEMVDKGLYVTLVLDCCHSGGATRAASNDAAPRGVAGVDQTKRPAGDPSLAPRAMTRNVSLGQGLLPEPKGYTLLAACRPNELAYEAAFDNGERHGALTYQLLDAFQKLGPDVTYKMVHEQVMARVNSQFERQLPMLEGEPDRVVFGVKTVPPVFAALVMNVDDLNARVLLQTGQSTGVPRASQFAIYPPDALDRTSEKGRKAIVEVVKLGATASWAKLVTPATMPDPPIKQGDHAVLIGAGSAKLVRGARLVRHDGQPITDQDTALKAVDQALAAGGSGWVEKSLESSAEFVVTVDEKGQEYMICDRGGGPIKNLRPALKVGDSAAPAKVVQRLVHLAKYRAVQDLENFDVNAPLRGQLVAELVGVQDDYEPGEKPDPQPFEQTDGRVRTVRPGQTVFLRIRNNASMALNIAVLDLQPDWGISQVFPRLQNVNSEPLDSKAELPLIALTAGLPNGYTEGSDLLKVFATVGGANFRVLELPALDKPSDNRAAKSRSTRGSALDRFLTQAAEDQPKTRDLTVAASASEEWMMVPVTVHIVAPPAAGGKP
jgi:hypothetical protein